MEPLAPLDRDYILDSDDDESMISSGDEEDRFRFRDGAAEDKDDDYTRMSRALLSTPLNRRREPVKDPFELEMDAEVAADICQLKHCDNISSSSALSVNNPCIRRVEKTVRFSSSVTSDSEEHVISNDVPMNGYGTGTAVGEDTANDSDQPPNPIGKHCVRRKRVRVLYRPSRIRHCVGKNTMARRERRATRSSSGGDLLYDPGLDSADQRWIDNQRRAYLHGESSSGRSRSSGTGSGEATDQRSDAVLNCPACMSMVCLDCQRHELYRSQYRAMFVFNCTVCRDRPLQYRPQPEQKHQKKSRRRRGSRKHHEMEESAVSATEVYLPVVCSTCNTDIAVLDTDEVYHFFNVIASHA